MATRKGRTIQLQKEIRIISSAAVAGRTEGEGPLRDSFDRVFNDTTMGEKCWEKAESDLLSAAMRIAMQKVKLDDSSIDAVFAGDLLNQCISSSFATRDMDVPFAGLFGACSTMALSALIASLAVESGGMTTCIAATSSHFCSAEKQFRFPLEYGGQRTPTAQRTVTGAGALILSEDPSPLNPKITALHLGTVEDLGIIDSTNMGAAMAPAARRTISDFLRDTNTLPSDYDAIFTGDLGLVGTRLLRELMLREDRIDIASVHQDCGLMIFDRETQDVHSGGSGCGCCGTVLCGHILSEMRRGRLKNILFVATGALMSSVSSREGESIPGVAHLLNIVI